MKILGLPEGCDLSFILYRPRIYWHGQMALEIALIFYDNVHSEEKESKQALCIHTKILKFSISWCLKYKLLRDLIQGDIYLFLQTGLFLSSLNIFCALTYLSPTPIHFVCPGISCPNITDSERFEVWSLYKNLL